MSRIAPHYAAAHHVSARQTDTMSMHLQGLPSCSAQWGAWGAAGMASDKPWLIARLARLGLGLLRPQEGLHALALMMQLAATPVGAFAWRANKHFSTACAWTA